MDALLDLRKLNDELLKKTKIAPSTFPYGLA